MKYKYQGDNSRRGYFHADVSSFIYFQTIINRTFVSIENWQTLVSVQVLNIVWIINLLLHVWNTIRCFAMTVIDSKMHFLLSSWRFNDVTLLAVYMDDTHVNICLHAQILDCKDNKESTYLSFLSGEHAHAPGSFSNEGTFKILNFNIIHTSITK